LGVNAIAAVPPDLVATVAGDFGVSFPVAALIVYW
jgi:hypothetical protein